MLPIPGAPIVLVWASGEKGRCQKLLVNGLLYVCCMHISGCMTTDRSANLLGALALSLTDALKDETEARAELGAAGPAALVTIGVDPGGSIHALAAVLGLSHSATVRLVDRLVARRLVERGAGADGRTLALTLTGAGRDRRRQILDGRRRVLSQALAPLTPPEQASFTDMVEKLLDGLTLGRNHADHICRLCDEDSCPAATCPVECAVTRHR